MSRSLPVDVLAVIKDFSRPITRPDWRGLHRMSSYKFHANVKMSFNYSNVPVIISFAERYDQNEYRYVFAQGANFEPIVIVEL